MNCERCEKDGFASCHCDDIDMSDTLFYGVLACFAVIGLIAICIVKAIYSAGA